VLRGIGRLTGGGFLEQMSAFITDLNDLFGGFRERATQVQAAFRGSEFAYVIVSTPTPFAIREALFFAERLREQGMRRDALVLNRVHRRPRFDPAPAEISNALGRHALDLGANGAERLSRALKDELAHAEADQTHLEELEGAFGSAGGEAAPARVEIPALPSDVHDIATLAGIAALLAPER
jgi:anion-transporting  ArsA/GET3 family ATPase